MNSLQQVRVGSFSDWISLAALLSCQVACSSASGGDEPSQVGDGPTVAGCPVFPADNPWNQDVSEAPVDPRSDAYIAHIRQNGGGTHLHADFSDDPIYSGIPHVVVGADAPANPVYFENARESDPGPYPIPGGTPVEGGPGAGGGRHVVALQAGQCRLFELYGANWAETFWYANSGASFDLRSNSLRPDGWTSADAAGLPIFPGLVRYEEAVEQGEIRHALRFTVRVTQGAYVHPATHFASSVTDPDAPPMGMRVRLKADFDDSQLTGVARTIAVALKRYGMFLADNGGNWFLSGTSHADFPVGELDQLSQITGDDFEVVELGPLLP